MASVTLHGLWVHRAADLADSVTLSYYEHARPLSRHGGVRRYAGGRMRSITSAGTSRQWRVACRYVPKPDADWLEARVDAHDLLLVRDQRGKKLYAVLLSFEPDEWLHQNLASFTAVFDEVTHSEAV